MRKSKKRRPKKVEVRKPRTGNDPAKPVPRPIHIVVPTPPCPWSPADLDDLLIGAPGEPTRDSPYRLMTRTLGIVELWLESDLSSCPPHVRRRMLAQVDETLVRLGQ